ncbi:MAG: aldehyde dehydrogenase (NADP(+)) [Chloroflexia bacterium]|nr:aldehyde dehydrogenase (NADP(+)) [Chloroflexia bacterium]
MEELTGKNIIGFRDSSEGTQTFQAFNPSNLEIIEDQFYQATESEVNEALLLASKAFQEYKIKVGLKKPNFWKPFPKKLWLLNQKLHQRACLETGLPEARIKGEIGRTTGQLNLFASLIREGSWCEATIDKGNPTREPLPKPDLRKMLVPIGAVVVFAASNFPLAFSVAGGDTASALAAGNPVVVKAHDSHPGTSEIVARAIQKAIQKTNMPEGTFSLIHGRSYEAGKKLVLHPATKAVGFTGSFAGGKALFDLANSRKEPIPFFAEMGSINPVFILNRAINNRGNSVAQQLAGSITLGVGQFCTKPGLVVIENNENTNEFLNGLAESLSTIGEGTMLNEGISSVYSKKTSSIKDLGVELMVEQSEQPRLKGRPVLAKIQANDFLKNPKLHEEIFGPFALVILCENPTEIQDVAERLEGQLTGAIIAEENELSDNKELVSALQEKVGRLIFNGMPTGVEVCHAMQHGGPFPASTDGRFTSVGTSAIKRFARPVAFQNWPEELLPDELKSSNPLNIMRLQENSWTRKALE